MGTKTGSIIIAMTAFATILAACATPNVPGPTATSAGSIRAAPTASPVPTQAPSLVASRPSAAPSRAAATAAPTARPTARPTPIVWTDDESFLMGGIRADAMGDCQPRRSDLPARSVAGVECRPAAAFVARVGAYAFRSEDDMFKTYRERLAEHGVNLDTGGCYAGTSGDSSWAASFAPDGESKPWARAGCYLDENNIANVRVTCDNAIYIGVLGTNSDMRALYAWALKNPPEIGGLPGYGMPPGICVGTGFDVY